MKQEQKKGYQRYHIETKKTPHIVEHSSRFNVHVNRFRLAKLLMQEFFHYRGKMDIVLSRPCVYGVFSGPIGGFAPRDHLCVGCLRCTVQYPDMVQITKNPERLELGDDYFLPDYVDTVLYEAESGRIPVKGAGYRGKFGGGGWDGLWTDMSEIIRPTRDGIHGRELISLEVDIGEKPPYVALKNPQISVTSIPIPIICDVPPLLNQDNQELSHSLYEAAKELKTYAILPFSFLMKEAFDTHIIPLVSSADVEKLEQLKFHPQFIEVLDWADTPQILTRFPDVVPILRTSYDSDLLSLYRAGVRVFHLTCDYHGNGDDGFVLDLIRNAHTTFVKAGVRDQITLIGSGGMIMAEHLAKGIICGLDLVAIDTPVMVALQATFDGQCKTYQDSRFILPPQLTVSWGKQRIMNLCAAWCDQLLEILGAMGIRDVRRLRGEMGRAMFQKDLENSAFSGITGYESR